MQTSTKYGFTFNGHHTSDFGLRVLSSKSMTLPAKNKVTVQLPYADGLLDLSDVYGTNNFGERTITFPCKIPVGYNDRDELYLAWTKIVNWLMSPAGKIKLEDDVMPDFYYLGEVQQAPQIQEFSVYSYITIVFQCYPYRFHHANTTDEWDPFRFDLDVAQYTKFDVKRSDDVLLINNGNVAVPLTLETNAPFKVAIGGEVFSVAKGITNSDEILIQPGENNITLIGTGHVSFDWYEEVI